MSNYRHGMKGTKIYGIWCAMRARCENPNVSAFKDYGGRGIKVCDRWKRFENFYADMGERPPGKTLERTDNQLGYSPGNCVWADRSAQNRNRRDRKLIEVKGEAKTLAEWSEQTGLSVGTLWRRLSKGWTNEEAIKTPKITHRKGIRKGERLRDYA